MRVFTVAGVRSTLLTGLLGLLLGAAPTFAQNQQKPAAPAPAPNPAPAAPAPKPAPAAPAPAAAPQPAPPVLPFPEGAKVAYIDIQRIIAESTEGKAASNKVKALNDKKVTELNEKNKQ